MNSKSIIVKAGLEPVTITTHASRTITLPAAAEDSMPSKRRVPEQEVAELSDEIVRLRAELDAATATFDDEEAAHQATLRLWQQAKAEIARLTEQLDALQQSASEWTEICEMVQEALAAATGKSAGGFMPMCFNDAIRKIATERDGVTEQRDRAMKALRKIESDTIDHVAVALARKALAALDTQSSPSLPRRTQ